MFFLLSAKWMNQPDGIHCQKYATNDSSLEISNKTWFDKNHSRSVTYHLKPIFIVPLVGHFKQTPFYSHPNEEPKELQKKWPEDRLSGTPESSRCAKWPILVQKGAGTMFRRKTGESAVLLSWRTEPRHLRQPGFPDNLTEPYEPGLISSFFLRQSKKGGNHDYHHHPPG